MKKTLFWLGIAMLSSASVFAQKQNVSKASNMLYQEPVDYAAAQEAIEMAKLDPTTAQEAKTWSVAGRIGYSMANKEVQKMYLNQQPDNSVMYKGLDMMYANYVQADKYDGVVDKKGKVKYKERNKIKADFKEMLNYYINTGAAMFDIQDFEKAYTMFSEYVAITQLDMFQGDKKPVAEDSTVQQINYYAAIVASRSEKHDIAIAHAKQVVAAQCKESVNAYQILAAEYMALADTATYLTTLQEACVKYPENPYFVGTIVNYYVSDNQPEEAIKYIDNEIARNPQNMEYMNVKASLLAMQMGKFEEARKVLEQALAIDANNQTSLYEMGRAWAFEGDDIQEKAQDLTSNAEYKKEVARAMEKYKEALKYYEPLRTSLAADSPLRYDLLQNMKVLYLRLQQTDKYQEVNAELQAM